MDSDTLFVPFTTTRLKCSNNKVICAVNGRIVFKVFFTVIMKLMYAKLHVYDLVQMK